MPKDTFFNLAEEKRMKIIRAAIDQFSDYNYSNVTINRLVQAADIPKGSFYQYFENKDDLYMYIFTQFGDTKLDLFERINAKIPFISFKEYMMEYMIELKKLEISNDQMFHLRREFLNQCPQHIKKEISGIEMPKSIEAFKSVIDAYIEKKEFRKDLDSRTAAFVALTSISNVEFYNYAEEEDVTAVLMRVMDFLVDSMN